MFGVRIGINAVDNTAKATKGAMDRLKNIGRNINALLNLGGLMMAFKKVGSAIDSAFGASTYSKEWEAFKDKISSGFGELKGRIADAWGPMLDKGEQWVDMLLGGIQKVIQRVQWLGAFIGSVFEGASFKDASKQADDVVRAMDEEYKRRKAAQKLEAESAELAKEREALESKASAEAKRRAKEELDMLKISGGDTSYSRTPATMKDRAAERQRDLSARAAGLPGELDYAGRGLLGHIKRPKRFGVRTLSGVGDQPTALQSAMGEMSASELEELMHGPRSAFLSMARWARQSAKRERKTEKMIAEARRRESNGVRLSGRMQAALALDKQREEESRAAQRAANVERAVQNLDMRVEQIAQEIVGSMTGGAQ